MNRKIAKLNIPTHIFLLFVIVITYFPFLFLLMTSFKDVSQFRHDYWSFSLPLHLENYPTAWNVVKVYMLNTVVITSLSVLGALLTASLSAFAFARFNFPGKTLLFYAVIGLLMIPRVLTLVPAFVWIKQLHLLNTHWALILPYISGGQVMGIYILRGFFASTPIDLYDSAKMDGANIFQMYWRIGLPLAKAILGVIAIMNLLWIWNDYIWPLVTLSDNYKRTITVGLSYFQGMYSTAYGPQFAGYIIASIPLFFLFLITMRYFVAGLTAGAIKM